MPFRKGNEVQRKAREEMKDEIIAKHIKQF